MKKRKFNPSRLYKLSKVLVIIVMILLGIMTLLNLNGLRYWKNYCWDQWNTGKMGYYKTIDQCTETADYFINTNQKNLDRDLPITIFLPLVFFGGTWLYKYLFPIKKNKE